MTPGQFERSISTLKRQISIILKNNYIIKIIGKILENSSLENIEDPDRQPVDALFIRQQLSELNLAIQQPFYCYPCAKGIATKNGVLSHLISKHGDCINAHMMDEPRIRRCCYQRRCNPDCPGPIEN